MGYGDDITGAKDSLDDAIKTASSFSVDNVHFDYKRTLHYDEDRVQCRGRFMRDTVTAIGPAETQHVLTFRLEISYQGTGIEDDLDTIIDYVGEIVDVNDPLKQGRARVRVFGFFDDLEIEDIPWAEQISGLSFSSSKGNGNISIPRVGSIVNVQFDGSNYYKLFYEFEKETNPALIEEIGDSYEGAQSLWYDTDAVPGALKLFYTKKKGRF